MARGSEVLTMLCPLGGWVIYGDDFADITWMDEAAKCTKEQFVAGFEQFDQWKLDQDTKAKQDKLLAQSKLEALGLSSDDLKALGL
jgi:hypothetical protein